MGLHDPLTGLYNRARFSEKLREIEGANYFPVTILMADVDNLKTVNDQYGHEAGDDLLQLISLTLKNTLRKEDTVARLGGDEFAAILPMTSKAQAEVIKRRIEENMNHVLSHYSERNIGLSVGVFTMENPNALSQAVKLADQKMYSEKASRREKRAALKTA